MHRKSPDKSQPATRDGWSSSAIAEDVIRPACLGFGCQAALGVTI